MRSRVSRFLKPITLSALSVGIVSVFLIFRHKPESKPRVFHTGNPPENRQRKPDLKIRDLIFEESEEGRILWKLRADRGRMYKTEDLALLDNVTVDFIQDQGENWHLTGNTGTVETKTLKMTIAGNVVARSDDGGRLNSELLHWDNKKRRVHTDRKVRIIREGHLINGVGLEFDLDLEELRIKSRVRSRFEPRGFSPGKSVQE